MSRVELTIATDYVRSWGLWEGFRELVCNARDAEKEFNAQMEITYLDGKIKILNRGCVLPLTALLLGGSTKVGHEGYIGQWGEGLKLALLCLTRGGYPVKIRNGSEVWVPRIAASEKFGGAKVIVVDIAKGRENQDRVSVEIDNVTKDEWKELRRNILWLDGRTSGHEDTAVLMGEPFGRILLNPSQRGRVYYRGVFVEMLPENQYGYDFTCQVELDRDRRMIQSWDRKWKTAKLWQMAANSYQPAMDKLMDLLAKDAAEIENMKHLGEYAESRAIIDEATRRFKLAHGASAVPVANLEEAKALEHLGSRGIVTSEVQRKLLEKSIGSVETVKNNLREQVTKRYSWADLTAEQKKNLEEAIEMVNFGGLKIGLADVDVVDFRDAILLGQYKDKRLLLASKVVSVWRECLATLIHEAAHMTGGDGEKAHVATIERTWAKLVEALWR
jgi:hypothetical protein